MWSNANDTGEVVNYALGVHFILFFLPLFLDYIVNFCVVFDDKVRQCVVWENTRRSRIRKDDEEFCVHRHSAFSHYRPAPMYREDKIEKLFPNTMST